MGTMIQNGSDVVSFLKRQHEQIKTLFNEVTSASGDDKARAFYALRRLLAVHETAEEEIVHPAARRTLTNGAAIVDERLREENEAKKALTELESVPIGAPDFDVKLRVLATAVIAHAEAEEQNEFAPLASKLDPTRLERMRKAAELAEAIAPTRPHPGIESSIANMLVGPFASMMDRARDALTGKS